MRMRNHDVFFRSTKRVEFKRGVSVLNGATYVRNRVLETGTTYFFFTKNIVVQTNHDYGPVRVRHTVSKNRASLFTGEWRVEVNIG
jgi:hypothetical protein